jgi:uncharacterized protein
MQCEGRSRRVGMVTRDAWKWLTNRWIQILSKEYGMNGIALGCTGVLGVLLFALGFAISIVRSRAGLLSGHAPEADHLLNKLVRAHGNTAEYAPFLAVIFLYLGSHNPPAWALWCVAGATASRLLLVVALLAWPTMSKPNPARPIGALGTYAFGVALCVALFVIH